MFSMENRAVVLFQMFSGPSMDHMRQVACIQHNANCVLHVHLHSCERNHCNEFVQGISSYLRERRNLDQEEQLEED